MNHYTQHAKDLFTKYRQMKSAELHADWIQHLPEQPGLACDIGAGSGRDANWLAEQGWDVIAVEPEAGFRTLAREQTKAHSHPNVAWLDDRLPELGQLRQLNQRFNLILLSAVWMHVPAAMRERAFRILSDLLAPGGVLVISLRHGSDEAENRARGMVLRHNDGYVEIPFGLVGLYWIKLYLPLVLKEHLIQAPSHKPVGRKGLGFAKPDHFITFLREIV